MSTSGSFIRRERLYILLLIFVILFNAAIIAPLAGKHAARRTAGPSAAVVENGVVQKANEDASLKEEELRAKLEANKPLAQAVNLTTLLVLAALFLGLFIDISLVIMKSEDKAFEISRAVPDQGPVPWNLWDVTKVVVLFLFFGYMLIMIESFLVSIFPLFKSSNFRMMLNSSILDILAVVFIIDIAARHYRERISVLGLSAKNFLRNVFYGIAGYLAAIPVLMLTLVITAIVIAIFKYTPEKQAVVQLFIKEENVPFLAYTSFFAAVAGPMIEELFFRGFLYGALKKYIGIAGAMAATGALFAGLHAHPVGFIPIMMIGMLLAYLYEKTGTLVASVTAHMIHNASMVGFVFLLKQLGV